MEQIFASENIRFAAVSERFIKDYLAMVNDYENVNRYIGGNNGNYTEAQEIEWVRKKLAENAPVFSMTEKESGRFIGNIELMDLTETQAELGIAITAQMQNRGYGTEAIRAIINYGFEHYKLQRICLRTRPFNDRAIHVYIKCGFREYRRDADHIYMELLR